MSTSEASRLQYKIVENIVNIKANKKLITNLDKFFPHNKIYKALDAQKGI